MCFDKPFKIATSTYDFTLIYIVNNLSQQHKHYYTSTNVPQCHCRAYMSPDVTDLDLLYKRLQYFMKADKCAPKCFCIQCLKLFK